METIDEEVTAKALDFMERAKKANKPFFLWWNSTRMHIFTHLKKESAGKTASASTLTHGRARWPRWASARQAQGTGLDENTIVMYSTDNGSESFSWPTGVPRCSGERRTRSGRVAIGSRR